MAEHCKLLLYVSALWRQETTTIFSLTSLFGKQLRVSSTNRLNAAIIPSPIPQGKFSNHSIISAFNYSIPSFQGYFPDAPGNNPERHFALLKTGTFGYLPNAFLIVKKLMTRGSEQFVQFPN